MKSVLVTGTSKGIGFSTALLCARAGYRVHATMRNPAGAPSLATMAAKEDHHQREFGGGVVQPAADVALLGVEVGALEAMCEGLAGEMKAFGVRVVLIKPGIIDTSMAQRISKIDSALYPPGKGRRTLADLRVVILFSECIGGLSRVGVSVQRPENGNPARDNIN